MIGDLALLADATVPVEGVDGRSREFTPGAQGPDTLTVYDSAHLGNRLYMVGDFTSAGGRTHVDIAAIDMRTRQVDHGFEASTNGFIDVVVPAADGRSVWIGGSFTSVNGQSVSHLARLDAATGALLAVPDSVVVNGRVRSLLVDGDRLYVSGRFTRAGGQARRGLAVWEGGRLLEGVAPRLTQQQGRLTGFAHTMVLRNGTLWLAGQFTEVNGTQISYATARVDPATGELVGDRPAFITPSDDERALAEFGGETGERANRARDLTFSGDGRIGFVAVGDNFVRGNRVHAFEVATGRGLWTTVMSGDPQALQVAEGQLFVGGHFGEPLGWGRNNPPLDIDPQLIADRLGVLDPATGAPRGAFDVSMNSWWGVWDIDATPWGLSVVGAFTEFNGAQVDHVVMLHADGVPGDPDDPDPGDPGDPDDPDDPDNPPNPGDPGDAACRATAQDGDVVLAWDAFNGEDEEYYVRVDGSWLATVRSDGQLTFRAEAGRSYLIRSVENGTRADLVCGEDGNQPGDPAACTITPQGQGARVTWEPFNGENDDYQVRADGVWVDSVRSDGRLAYQGEPGVSYTIVSQEQGVRSEIDCG